MQLLLKQDFHHLEMDQWFMYLTMNQTIYYLLLQLVFDQQNEDLFIIINTN